MAKASIDTGQTAQAVHTRTTAGAEESQAVVLAGDGTDSVIYTPAVASGLALTVAGSTLTPTTGTITTATSTVTSGDLSSAGAVTIGIYGTYAGVNASFEGSPDAGTTWFPVAATREDSAISEATTGVLTANTSRLWLTGMPGLNRLRVRATAYTSGTANVILVAGSMPIEPMVGAVMTGLPVTGTQTNVGASATSVTIKAANTARKGLMVYNAGTSDLYLNLAGATATTTTAFSVRVGSGELYELPDDPMYVGAVTGIWAATGGNGANVTEFTA